MVAETTEFRELRLLFRNYETTISLSLRRNDKKLVILESVRQGLVFSQIRNSKVNFEVLYLQPMRKFEKVYLSNLAIDILEGNINYKYIYISCFLKDILEFQPIKKFENTFTFNQSENSKITLLIKSWN